jgi:SHS2 domain-containing protein
MKDYELIDHTADIGVKAFGKDFSEAFAHAAKAMFDIITDSSVIESKGRYQIDLTADDLEQLLVDWLDELLFLQGAENLVFGKFKVNVDEKKYKLSAMVSGEEFDTQKHKSGMEIKAVTYHMLEVHKNETCFVQVLFDV